MKTDESLITYDNYKLLEADIQALKTISESTKQMLILTVQGYTEQDIADIMSMKTDTVRKRLQRLRNSYEVRGLLKGGI